MQCEYEAAVATLCGRSFFRFRHAPFLTWAAFIFPLSTGVGVATWKVRKLHTTRPKTPMPRFMLRNAASDAVSCVRQNAATCSKKHSKLQRFDTQKRAAGIVVLDFETQHTSKTQQQRHQQQARSTTLQSKKQRHVYRLLSC